MEEAVAVVATSTIGIDWRKKPRSRRHRAEGHGCEWGSCILCWPGAVLCGDCGHATWEGMHGRLDVNEHGILRLTEPGPCSFAAVEMHHTSDTPRCGCTRRSAAIIVVVETAVEQFDGKGGRWPQARPRTFRRR